MITDVCMRVVVWHNCCVHTQDVQRLSCDTKSDACTILSCHAFVRKARWMDEMSTKWPHVYFWFLTASTCRELCDALYHAGVHGSMTHVLSWWCSFLSSSTLLVAYDIWLWCWSYLWTYQMEEASKAGVVHTLFFATTPRVCAFRCTYVACSFFFWALGAGIGPAPNAPCCTLLLLTPIYKELRIAFL